MIYYNIILSFFLSFFLSLDLSLPTHCTYGGLLLQLITLIDKNTRYCPSGRRIGPSQRPLPAQHTLLTRDSYPCTPSGFEPAIPASERAGGPNPGFRPRGHWGRQEHYFTKLTKRKVCEY